VGKYALIEHVLSAYRKESVSANLGEGV